MCHYRPNNSTIECLSTEKRTDRAKEKANDAQMNAVAKKVLIATRTLLIKFYISKKQPRVTLRF